MKPTMTGLVKAERRAGAVLWSCLCPKSGPMKFAFGLKQARSAAQTCTLSLG